MSLWEFLHVPARFMVVEIEPVWASIWLSGSHPTLTPAITHLFTCTSGLLAANATQLGKLPCVITGCGSRQQPLYHGKIMVREHHQLTDNSFFLSLLLSYSLPLPLGAWDWPIREKRPHQLQPLVYDSIRTEWYHRFKGEKRMISIPRMWHSHAMKGR